MWHKQGQWKALVVNWLAAQLTQYESVLKSLPGGDDDPIRMATLEKVKGIREQQRALRTPEIAHRRTAQDLHRAKAARDKDVRLGGPVPRRLVK